MKTRIPWVVLSLVAAEICFAQGQWSQIGEMPEIRYAHTVNELEGKIYVVGGANTETSVFPRTALICDTSSGTWTQIPLHKNQARIAHSSCVLGGRLYVVGGRDSSRVLSTMDMFDPDSGQWVSLESMSTDRTLAACVSIGGKIYVIGGMRSSGSSVDFNGLATVEVYDTSSGLWTQLADMPTKRWGHSAVAVNDQIYVFGGASFGAGTLVYSSVEVYDPQTNTWATRSNMPTPRYCLTASLLGGKIYAVGGWLHSSWGPLYDRVEVYDPERDEWYSETPMPVARAVLASVALDDKTIVFGGASTTHPNVGTSGIYEFELSSVATDPRTLVIYAEPGGLSDSIRCTVRNNRPTSVEIASVGKIRATPFEVFDLPSFPRTLVPGDSLAFGVAFHPTAPGAFRDTVLVDAADPGLIDARIPLSGAGIIVSPLAQTGWYASKSGYPSGSLLRMSGTGAFAPVGLLGIPEVQGMAVDTAGFCYGVEPAGSFAKIYRIDGTLGGCALRLCLPLPGLRAIAFGRNDTLYGATSGGRLYRLSLATGDTVFVGSTDRIRYAGLCFSPTSGRLWASSSGDNDTLYVVDHRTGEPIAVGSSGADTAMSSIAFARYGQLFGLTEGWDSYFVRIDTVSALATRIGRANPGYRALAFPADIVGVVQDGPGGETPNEFALLQNYPNPFNPSTTIKYGLPERSHVTLTIFNTLGQQVATLVEGEMDAGYHEVTFDASHLPTGVYLYRLQAGGRVQVGKALLVK